ncbi:MAG: glycosyltransferase [Clostridium paraputrificum]|nr:glycosyltransferase [Clostridium paraputrificum]MDY4721988.1 glycosyltransferase [Clostridium paraputrificum]
MKKRIVIVHENLNLGGAEKVLVEILNRLNTEKYDITLLLLKYEGIYINNLNSNINVEWIYKPIKNMPMFNKIINGIYYRFLFKYFGKNYYNKYIRGKYDVEVAFMEGISTRIIAAEKATGKKISWIHTDLKELRTMSYKEEKYIYRNIDKVVCVSQGAKESFDSLYECYRNKSLVIYNYLNSDKIIEMSKEPFKTTKFSIVFVGRLVSCKRVDLLIDALSNIIKKDIDIQLIVVGDGVLKPELMRRVEELNIIKNVNFVGYSNNPYKYIKNSDIYISTSDYEGFCLSVAEAMILGKAIISTKTVGTSELLRNGEYGINVECGNLKEIESAILHLFENNELRKEYERKSIERSSIFKGEYVISQIESLIDE